MVQWSTQKLGAHEVCSLNPTIFIMDWKNDSVLGDFKWFCKERDANNIHAKALLAMVISSLHNPPHTVLSLKWPKLTSAHPQHPYQHNLS